MHTAKFCAATLMAAALLTGAAQAAPKLPAIVADAPDDFCNWTINSGDTSDNPVIYCLGAGYLERRDIAPEDKARDLKSAAKRGDARAMLLLAHVAFFAWDDAKGLTWLNKAAKAHELDAMCELAAFHARGFLMKANIAKAKTLYSDAINRGSVHAISGLAALYATQGSAAYDEERATLLFVRAAEAGDVGAMMTAGVRYRDGVGVARSGPEAIRWLTQAYAHSSPVRPAGMIAQIYDKGELVPADPALAFHWYQLAAQSGDNSAMSALAIMYRDGRGTTKDEQQARYWEQRTAVRPQPPVMAPAAK